MVVGREDQLGPARIQGMDHTIKLNQFEKKIYNYCGSSKLKEAFSSVLMSFSLNDFNKRFSLL